MLESAKQEYRGLYGVEQFKTDLRIYNLGSELCVPFRLNPFELLPGIRVEAHLGKLRTCFEGAIPPIGLSSSVIAEALLRIYEESGWILTDTSPTSGKAGKKPTPSAVILDSQSVKTTHIPRDHKGYDGGKKIKGRKRRVVGQFSERRGLGTSVFWVAGCATQSARISEWTLPGC